MDDSITRAPPIETAEAATSSRAGSRSLHRIALERLSTSSALIAGERDPQSLIQRVTEEAMELVGAQFGAFLYCRSDAAAQGHELYAPCPAAREVFAALALTPTPLAFASTLAGERIVRSEDITLDPRFVGNPLQHATHQGQPLLRSYLAVSIKSINGEVLGGLFFLHAKAGAFDDTAERALAALAPVAGAALTNARLLAQLAHKEAELESSEARNRLVSEAMQEGVWYWDVPSNRVEWNDRLLQLMGVSREQWGGSFDDWFARLHPDDQPHLALALKAHLERRVPYRVDLFRLRHADGRYRWCMTAGQTEWGADGRPLRMAGSFRDVTDRKVTEERLHESELRFAQILDSVQDIVFTKNDQLRVTWANTAACKYYGATVKQLQGIADVASNPSDFTEQYQVDDRAVFETGQPVERSEEPNLSLSGELRTFHTVKTPIKDAAGRVIELVGVSRDVTERKRELDAQRLLAEASAILSASLDYETTLANVARATVPTFADWSAVDMLEDGQLRRLAVHHQQLEKVALAHELHEKYPPDMQSPHGIARVLRTKQVDHMPEISDEMLVAGAKDAEHLAHLKQLGLRSYIVAPIVIAERVVGVISFVSAESKRRYGQSDVAFASELARRGAVAIENARLYRQVSELAATLERRIEQRTAALVESNKELESFSYTVSHDLRAPVRHISGFVDLVRESAGSKLDPGALRYLETIKGAATQMGTLIDGLLSFSRLGRAQVHKQSVDLSGIVAAVLLELEPDLLGRRIEWSIAKLPRVSADATMLRLVIANLVGNAVKYTSPKTKAQIAIGASEQDGETVVWVEDDGVGFDMQYVDKLFGVFQRLHTDDQFEGTGIGLATVRRVIRRHGGRTWAKGALGAGATFYFSLPSEETAS